ncbi:DSPc-domain-containing protein [Aspergillus aurantiobrunneus]
MADTCDFIEQMASLTLQSSTTLPVNGENESSDVSHDARPGGILVHCDMAVSRSPTIIIVYLMRKYRACFDGVLGFVQSRQKVRLSATFTRQLRIWERVGYEIWEDGDKTVRKALYQEDLDERPAVLTSKGLTGNEPLAPLTL